MKSNKRRIDQQRNFHFVRQFKTRVLCTMIGVHEKDELGWRVGEQMGCSRRSEWWPTACSCVWLPVHTSRQEECTRLHYRVQEGVSWQWEPWRGAYSCSRSSLPHLCTSAIAKDGFIIAYELPRRYLCLIGQILLSSVFHGLLLSLLKVY